MPRVPTNDVWNKLGFGRRRLTPREALDRLPARLRVAALGETLRLAPPPEAPDLVLMLLDDAHAPGGSGPAWPGALERVRVGLESPRRRAADEALVALASSWNRVPADLRGPTLAVGRGRWSGAIARAARSTDAGVRESAAALIHDARDLRSAGVAGKLLLDEDRGVSRAADRAMLTLALSVCGIDPAMLGRELDTRRGESVEAPEQAGEVTRHIAEGAWAYGDAHRGRDTLLAVLLLAPMHGDPRTPTAAELRLAALLETPGHDAVGALRTLIRTTPAPEMRARAWRWMGGGPMAAAALERVSKAKTDEEHAAVLSLGHLALRPSRRTALSAIGVKLRTGSSALGEGGVLPTPGFWARLEPRARRGAVLMSTCMSVPRPVVRAVFAPTLGDPDAIVRHRAARACDPMDLVDYAFDADPRVARTAALRWSAAGVAGSTRRPRHAGDERRQRVARKLARVGHRAVRGIAVEDAGRADSWEPGGVTSRIVARKWAQEDRDGFVVSARERLRDPSEDARTSAIGVIRAIGAGALLELELGELACDAAMPRAAATAARALGCVDTPGSRSALTKAARSSDARVRANAVESLARLSGPTPDTAAAAVFIECKADRHHRVRASAVRALVERPGGADLSASLADVRAMLDDARGEHRLAGVWVAERVLGGIGARAGSEACERLMERMTELATGDASSAVRARATRCVRRVLVEASYAGGGA